MRQFAVYGLAFLLAALLAGCGGGGGDGERLSGTAAYGLPIPNAPVVIKDSTGTTVNTTTNTSGFYSVGVGGMTPPFLAQVTTPPGDTLYSIATEAGTANIDPFTNLVTETYYTVQGTTSQSGAPTFGTGGPLPSPVETQSLAGLVERTIQPWLAANGVDPVVFDIGTTPYVANSTGYDHVIEISTIILSQLAQQAAVQGTTEVEVATIVITDGVTTQSSTVTADTSGNVVVDNSTTGPNGTSQSQDSTTIPPTDAARAAEEGVAATLQQFADTANAKGAALTDADLQPFMASNLLNEGKDRTIFSADVATGLRGVTVDSFTISRINSYDALNDILDIEATLILHQGAQTSTERVTLAFKRVGASYLVFGDQRVAQVNDGSVQFEKRTDSTSGGDTTNTSINVDVDAPLNTISAVKITGPGGFSDTPLTKSSTTRTDVLKPTPSTTLNYVTESFFANSGPITLPSTPATYAIELTLVATGTQVYNVTVTGSAGEAISYSVNPNTHSKAAVKGQTITVSWSLPQTYAADRIRLSGHMTDGVTELDIESSPKLLGATATSATLTFTPPAGTPNPSTFNPTNFNLDFDGPNGERSIVIFQFDQS